ncbi:hypothetical protein [Streptomyces sp. CB01373]|uniref:hypothetical protein n=1 Tax=Streptomyces sp. CB01373 TaxID=2020325 RepID=UPI000C273C8C|nr:hypothetical protein [Streptomyces sp. CB01373]PJM91460.1 hypothetical protein CG719_33950 [Streptomyces sp. CB01373]
MRLRTACPATPRAWTVELRSHADGLVLVCRHCPHGSTRTTAAAARSAALAHLARHARGDLRPPHLRICQCHERGCAWHPRHRGCASPIRLLLAREHGGRLWRLADACTACAAATAQAAVVPDTVLTRAPLQPETGRRHRRRPKGPGEQIRVREMLSYLAAALPAGTSAAARLLALQCALRMSTTMEARLSKGVLRSLRLNTTPGPWRELEHARWLRPLPESTANEIVVALLDAAVLGQAPARPDRMRAADWALRASTAGAIGPVPQLMHLYLAAHTDPHAGSGLCELDQMARACGVSPAVLPGTLDQLAATGLLKSWQACPDSEDLHWTLHALS